MRIINKVNKKLKSINKILSICYNKINKEREIIPKVKLYICEREYVHEIESC